MTEHEIQNQILREFGTRPELRLWRANTGAARFGKQLIRFGIPGQADLTGLLMNGGGVRLEIEVKTPAGRLSEDQINFGNMITKLGGVYIVARSVGDVWNVIGKYIKETE